MSRTALLAATIAGISACNPSAVRPSYLPLSGTLYDTVSVEPGTVMAAARAEVEDLGLEIEKYSAVQGYLQTRWYDPRDSTSHGSATDPDTVFRLRIWADRLQRDQAQFAVEAVYPARLDPSLPERQNVEVAGPGHPGHAFALSLVQAIKDRFDR